jgi:DNA-directed RNA polymerase II subunit RPB1
MNEHGHEATRNFLDQIQRLINYWLMNRGFSLGIEDFIVDDQIMEKIHKSISYAKNVVKELIMQLRTGQVIFIS